MYFLYVYERENHAGNHLISKWITYQNRLGIYYLAQQIKSIYDSFMILTGLEFAIAFKLYLTANQWEYFGNNLFPSITLKTTVTWATPFTYIHLLLFKLKTHFPRI